MAPIKKRGGGRKKNESLVASNKKKKNESNDKSNNDKINIEKISNDKINNDEDDENDKMNNDDEDTSSSNNNNKINLHDCLALGEIEKGLSQTDNRGAVQEIQRLPLFLRVLSLTRPQSSISSVFFGNGSSHNEDSGTGGDELVNRAVEKLEDVVAKHSVAEGVDVVTCHLAPSVTRKLSKVPPLQQKKDGEWDTKELAAVARNPRSTLRKRKLDDDGDDDGSKRENDDGIQGSSDEEGEGEEMDEETNQLESLPDKSRKKGKGRRDSMEVAAEDSQEATVTKTLSELASLVVTSLEPISDQNDSEEPGKTGLSLTMDDSILSESAGGAAESGGGAMEGSDLGSTVSSIMHHAPVLRSRQVANALCRASIPQGGNLMSRMGANCPAAVPSLLLGCIQAYSMAIPQGNISICNVAKQSVTALAKLSMRERCRVLSKLQSSNIMLDVQLKLAMDTDVVTATCFILNNLSVLENATFESDGVGNSVEETESRTQAPGDASSDFRALEKMDYNPIVSNATEPTLLQLLSTNRVLCKETFLYLVRSLQSETESQNIATGKLCVLLKSLAVILLVPGKTSPKFDLLEFLLKDVFHVLKDVMGLVERKVLAPMEAPETSTYDSLTSLLRCCVLLTTTRILSDETSSSDADEQCKILIQLSREIPYVSRRSWGFRYCLDFAMKQSNPSGLFAQIANMLTGGSGHKVNISSGPYPTLELGMKRLCDICKEEVEGDLGDADVSFDLVLSSLRIEMPNSYGEGDEALISLTKRMLEKALAAEVVLSCETIPRFIVDATQYLFAKEHMHIPAVLSSHLEKSASKTILQITKKKCTLDHFQSKFMLQLLHSFEFLDLSPKSPFAFDPRSFPIKEAISIISCAEYTEGFPFLAKKLRSLVGKHCPEVLIQTNRSISGEDALQTLSLRTMSRSDIIHHLCDSIRSCVEVSADTSDYKKVEEIFLAAKARLSDADLYSTVVSAFLASPNKPPPVYSYYLLCRDPLALLKCPMRVWKHRELRRIIISSLSFLLETNAALAVNTSPSEDSADEYLSARNVMVVRCLLIIVSGSGSENSIPDCSMTTSLIRSIISGQRGIVATLVKQGLDGNALDWLTDSVPETMYDSQDLLQLLSQHSPLTAAEKLRVADSVIRIAIIHGESNETDAANMVYTSLAILVDSFFLVVGPVGVPVNALMSPDNSGLDITQIARNAAFRILKSLLLVRGRRTRVQKECGMALQKLAALCKGESANVGVGGTVAGRRKALLKEIYDAVMRATNSMGSSVGATSVAA